MNILLPHTVDLNAPCQVRVMLVDLEEWALPVATVYSAPEALVTTRGPHGLSVGDSVLLTGCRDTTGINRQHTVKEVVTENSFTLDNTTAGGRYAGGGLVFQIRPYTVDQMPWQAYVGYAELQNLSYVNGVFDADDTVVKNAEEGKCYTALALWGRNDPATKWQMMALMVDGIGLPAVANGQPITILFANTADKIFSGENVSSPYVFMQKTVAFPVEATVHLIGRDLADRLVYLDGKAVEDVLEAKRYPNGEGFLVTLRDLDGSTKKWIDGQMKNHTRRGVIDIQWAS